MKGRRESHDRLQMSVVIIFFYCPACLLLTGFTHSHSKMIHEESWRHRALVSVSCKQKATGQPCLSFWWSCLSPKIVECSCKMALQSSPLATSGLAKIRTLAKQHCLQFSFKKALPSKLLQKTVPRQWRVANSHEGHHDHFPCHRECVAVSLTHNLPLNQKQPGSSWAALSWQSPAIQPVASHTSWDARRTKDLEISAA